jgi:Polyketide cyclase / dehydrase and lipid transport
MAVVTERILVAAPPESVWAVLADLPGQPSWMRDLKEVRLTTSEPVAAGSRAIGLVRIFGLSAEDPIEIDAFEPGVHFGLVHLGAFAGRGDFWLSGWGSDLTLVRWREALAPDFAALGVPSRLAWLWPVVDPIFGLVLRAVFRADLRRLKRLVEASR